MHARAGSLWGAAFSLNEHTPSPAPPSAVPAEPNLLLRDLMPSTSEQARNPHCKESERTDPARGRAHGKRGGVARAGRSTNEGSRGGVC